MANFYCEYCGQKYSNVQSLTLGICSRHPNGSGKHKLYQGSEKDQYTCKHCGQRFSTLTSLVTGICSRHKVGAGNGKHEPAL